MPLRPSTHTRPDPLFPHTTLSPSPRLLHLERDLCDDDLEAATLDLLDLPARAQPERAPACLVGLQDTATSLDEDATGRKIRAGHEIHQLVDRGIGRLDHVQQRVADFADVDRKSTRLNSSH